MMLETNLCEVCFTFFKLCLMAIPRRALLLVCIGMHCEVFNRFTTQILRRDALTLASFNCLLSQLVSFLPILVNES